MSVRALSLLAVSVLMVLAGCSGNDEKGSLSDGESSQPAEAPSASTEPTYTNFDDFPGDELLYYQFPQQQSSGLRLKAVDSAWATEIIDSIAEPTDHYLVVYVAVTGELDDRGTSHASLEYAGYTLSMRFKPTVDSCKTEGAGDPDYCYEDFPITSALQPIDGNDWLDYSWQVGGITGVDIAAGQTMIGVVAFSVADSIDAVGDFEFCAQSKESSIENGYEHPCVVIPAPEPRT